MSPSDPLADWHDLNEAAALVGIHRDSLRRLIKKGDGPAVMTVAGKFMVQRDELARWRREYESRPGRKSVAIAG